MKSSDIDDQHVIDLAQAWQQDALDSGSPVTTPGVVQALIAEGVPKKLAFAKVERLSSRGFLDYGVSPSCAWPTGKKLGVEQ